MAIQDGIIKLKGQIGDLSFFKTKDGYRARKKSGIDGNRLRNDPAFERTRENASEFARAGVASRMLRTAFRPLLLRAADSRVTSRLTREMTKVIKADAVNLRGQRNVIDGEVELLRGFEFNDNARIVKTFFPLFTASIDRATGTGVIDIPAFIPTNMIVKPEGATHFMLSAGIAEIDFQGNTYVVSTSTSETLLIGTGEQEAIQLTQAVTAGSTQPLFLVFAIEFFQMINENQYPLNNGAFNALALVEVSGAV